MFPKRWNISPMEVSMSTFSFRNMDVKESELWALFREMDKILCISVIQTAVTQQVKSLKGGWTKIITCLINNVSEIRQLFSVHHITSEWLNSFKRSIQKGKYHTNDSVTHSSEWCQISVQWKNQSSLLHFTYFHIHFYLRPSHIKTLLQPKEICSWTYERIRETLSIYVNDTWLDLFVYFWSFYFSHEQKSPIMSHDQKQT